MAYGGPGSLDEVEPFLKHVLSRNELPPGMVQASQNRYAQIGGQSPLLEITQQQADALQTALARSAPEDVSFRVYIGMKHWHPFIHETVKRIVADGFDSLVGVCLAPQYSDYAVGGYFRLLKEALLASGSSASEENGRLLLVEHWHTHPGFLQAWAENIRPSLRSIPAGEHAETLLLFTAHSLPLRLVPEGDPYPRQVQETAQAISRHMGWPLEHMQHCYQCTGRGGGAWLGPDLVETLAASAAKGYRNVVLVPSGFVADHVETLYDLDIDLREQAIGFGLNYVRVPSLNTSPSMIEALKKLILGKGTND